MVKKSSGDATGWKRGEKGYATGGQWDGTDKEFLRPDFDVEKQQGPRGVGQFPNVGDRF